MSGKPYGYHNMIFSWTDTVADNYPPPLDAHMVVNFSILVKRHRKYTIKPAIMWTAYTFSCRLLNILWRTYVWINCWKVIWISTGKKSREETVIAFVLENCLFFVRHRRVRWQLVRRIMWASTILIKLCLLVVIDTCMTLCNTNPSIVWSS
jgi:hypothetical protein